MSMSLRNPVITPGIDPGTVRLVAQRLNRYATQDLSLWSKRSFSSRKHPGPYLEWTQWVQISNFLRIRLPDPEACDCMYVHSPIYIYGAVLNCELILTDIHIDNVFHWKELRYYVRLWSLNKILKPLKLPANEQQPCCIFCKSQILIRKPAVLTEF